MNAHAISCHPCDDAQNRSLQRRGLIRRSLLVFLTLVSVSSAGCTGLGAARGADPGAPSISSQLTDQTVVVGQRATFSVVASGATPLRYQWMKSGTIEGQCDQPRRYSRGQCDAADTVISGATSASYTTPATTISDNGARFAVVLTNSTGSVISRPATLTVNAPGRLNASLSNLNFGNVTLGKSTTLLSTLSAFGTSNVTISNFSISDSGFGASGVSAGLILTPGQNVTLNVAFAPAAAGTVTGRVTITSDASNSPMTISLSGSGVQPESHSVNLTWAAGISTVDGYNAYRATISGGPYARLNPLVNANATFTDTTIQAGQTYYYVVTAVDSSGVESTYSNEVSVTIPSP
jgi:hypothetical protein